MAQSGRPQTARVGARPAAAAPGARPATARPASARPSAASAPSKGSGTVSEDKYLTLEAEYRILKKEHAEREGKQKVLLARLARTEEAAKRAMLKAGHGKGTLSVAKQFDFEAENAELHDKLREAQRKIDAQHERVLHFKNVAKDYKAKLADAMRLAKSHRAGRGTIGGGAGRKSHLIAVPEPLAQGGAATGGEQLALASAEAARQFMALRRELEALREENAELTTKIAEQGEGAQTAQAPAAPAAATPEAPAPAEAESADRLRREVATLRRELADARAAAAEANPLIAPRIVSGDVELAAEVKSAWEHVARLQARYDSAHGNLDGIKANHERVLNSLDESNRALAVERKRSLELESQVRRLQVEIAGLEDYKLMLQEARAEIVVLSKENTELLNSAMKAPATAMEEARSLRQQIAQHERERADMEIAHAKARMEAVEGRASAPDATQLEVFKLRAELTVARERIKALEEATMSAEEIRAQLPPEASAPPTPARPGAQQASAPPTPLPAPDLSPEMYEALGISSDVATLQAELVTARQEISRLHAELDKAKKMLAVQEEIAAEYKAGAEAAGATSAKGTAGGDRAIAQDREIARLRDRVRKLEAQLVGSGRDNTRTLRAGSEAVDVATPASAANDAQVLAACAADESVFELVLQSAELKPSATMGARSSTFLSVDFYEHETQATAVQAGLRPEFNATLHYVCKADEFLARHMVEKQLVVELQRAAGVNFSQLGVAVLDMRQALRASAYGERHAGGVVDITSPAGVALGKLRYSARLLRALPPSAVAAAEAAAADLILSSASARGAASSGARPTSAVRVIVERCVRLRQRPGAEGGEAAMRPYVSYTLPGCRRHDTAVQRGADPVFNDARAIPHEREGSSADRLAGGVLDLQVFDDEAPEDDAEAGVVGLCEVPLADFVRSGLPLSGAFPLRDRFGAPTGHVVLHVVWQDARTEDGVAALARQQSGWGIARTDGDAALEAAEAATAAVGAAATAKALPAPPPLVELPPGLPDPSQHVILSVHSVAVGEAALAALGAKRMFVLYEFLTDFCDVSDQRTPSVEAAANVDFGFTRAFNVDAAAHPEAAEALVRMASASGSEASISFSFVSEDGANAEELAEFAYGELSLAELLASGGDYVEREVTMVGAEGEQVGTATVTLIAYRALASVKAASSDGAAALPATAATPSAAAGSAAAAAQ